MTDPQNSSANRALLERRLRAEFTNQARRLFPDQEAPTLVRAPRSEGGRARWLAPLLAAGAVAAAVVVATSVYAGHHSSPTANAQSVTAASPAAATSASGRLTPPASAVGYPEATSVAGVTVLKLTPAQLRRNDVEFIDVFPPEDVLVKGRGYPLGEQIVFGPEPYAGQPVVVTVAAVGATLACPPPFVIRPGHAYKIDCTVTPVATSGTVAVHLTSLRGGVDYSDQTTPFAAR